ncbi:MAG: hypothetical protein PHQ60_06405 [Sideroxydans sp.]|nr:hypothetical protein [Sideroxydans sp.]
MSDCCSQPDCHSSHPKKQRCPACGQECAEVSARTISHHIKQSWTWTPAAARYFFCDNANCDVVYFGDDGSTLVTAQLRTRIGVKDKTDDRPLCFCFGVNRADFQRDPAVKDFVIAQTQAGLCSCETSNPSGRCCLKDFPKVED